MLNNLKQIYSENKIGSVFILTVFITAVLSIYPDSLRQYKYFLFINLAWLYIFPWSIYMSLPKLQDNKNLKEISKTIAMTLTGFVALCLILGVATSNNTDLEIIRSNPNANFLYNTSTVTILTGITVMAILFIRNYFYIRKQVADNLDDYKIAVSKVDIRLSVLQAKSLIDSNILMEDIERLNTAIDEYQEYTEISHAFLNNLPWFYTFPSDFTKRLDSSDVVDEALYFAKAYLHGRNALCQELIALNKTKKIEEELKALPQPEIIDSTGS